MDYPMTFGAMAGKEGWNRRRMSDRTDLYRPRLQFIPISLIFNFGADSRLSGLDFQASASSPLLASIRSLVLSDPDDPCSSFTTFSV
jgi:hypothetical protein